MKKLVLFALIAAILLSLTACAPGPNVGFKAENPEGEIAGFWMGIWHGMIAPITFIISLFNKNVNVYEVFNTGGWYNFGFMLGLSMSLGGSGGGAGRASRRK